MKSIKKKIGKLTFWELALWELTFWEVDISEVDILGFDILGVDILRLTPLVERLVVQDSDYRFLIVTGCSNVSCH